MRGYIVGYLESWGDNLNPKIVGQFSNWKIALDTAKKLVKPLIKVYIVETVINKTIDPQSATCWINDYKHFIVYKDNIVKMLPVIETGN